MGTNQAQAKYRLAVDDKTAGALRAVEKNFKQHIDKVSSYGKSLSIGLSAPIAAFGALALKTTADFQTSMNRVEGITGATAGEMAKLNAQAKALGASTSFSASEAGDAMGFLAQAGFKADQILGAMPSTLQLAEAAQMDLAAAADITSNILAGYGKQVEDLTHINDVLVKAADATNTDIAGLGEAMSYVAPVASGMGLAFEETVGALGMLSNAGIKGSMAGTTLREVLGSLANPSKEAAELLEKMSISAFDSSGKMKQLTDIMGQLQLAGMTAGEALQIFGQRAGPGMLALVNQGARALTDLKVELNDSGGAAKHMAEVQMKGLNGALKNLQSAFEGLQIALVESGILEWVTNFITRLAGWISMAMTTDSETKKLVLTIVGWAAAAGPLLTVMGKVVAIVGFLTSPIGAVIGAIGLMVLAWAKWGEDIKIVIKPALDWVREEFDKIVNFILTMSDVLHGWGVGMYQMRGMALAAANKDGKLLEDTLERIKKFYEDLKSTIENLGSAVPPIVAGANEVATAITGVAASGAKVYAHWTGWLVDLLPAIRAFLRAQASGQEEVKDKIEETSWAAREQSKIMRSAFADAAEGLASSFADAVFYAQNLLEGLANTARSVLSMIATGLIKLGLAKIFPSLAPAWGFVETPKKSMTGGRLAAGQASWVGENGRELWIPDTAGTVVPSSKLGGGAPTINVALTINVSGDITRDPMAFRAFAIRLRREFEVIAKTYYDPSAQAAG